MGLFWDKLKKLMRWPVYDPEQEKVVDAANWDYEMGSDPGDWERQIEQPKFTTIQGTIYVSKVERINPIHRNAAVHNRKRKSQRRNWKHWKRKI